MTMTQQIEQMLDRHARVKTNVSRELLIYRSVHDEGIVVTSNGALLNWTPPESTGRSPEDTLIVENDGISEHIDWTAPNNIPLDEETFSMIFEDALALFADKKSVYVCDRVLGADSSYALPVRTVTDNAFTALFVDNMFRPVPIDIDRSVFNGKEFSLLVLPNDKLDKKRYEGRLRTLPDGTTSDMAVVMDFKNRIGVVLGSAYLGSVKKLMFTVMNYYLPDYGILPLHCSANEGKDGVSALLLGLSGTGKTTLSTDPDRALIGDDEHGWGDNGVANFENGCYAKLINLDPKKEPEIYDAVFHKADYMEHGAIIENCMIYPNGTVDFDDDRLTPNSRASYPLTFLSNIKQSAMSSHPSTILFLVADANGVLPPVAKLSREQAMLWFLMGYTSKLAGTETGIVEPVSTFSRFFGAPFMPRNPRDYSDLLGEKMEKHNTKVYLINTGWSGGSYGVGKRMDITLTRTIVTGALSGAFEEIAFEEDSLFHFSIPTACPYTCLDIDSSVLNPINTWVDKEAFKERAHKLASDFAAHFDKTYAHTDIPEAVKKACPGK